MIKYLSPRHHSRGVTSAPAPPAPPAAADTAPAAGPVSYLHRPGSEPLQYTTVGAELARAADEYPGRRALRVPHEDLTLTYEELLIQSDALGVALRSLGLAPGARVAVLARGGAAWILAMCGALRVGLVPVAINPELSPPELAFCLRKTGAEAAVVGAGAPLHSALCRLAPGLAAAAPGALADPALPALRVLITTEPDPLPGTFSLPRLVAEYRAAHGRAGPLGAAARPEDASLIHFTSGTTGEPKAAVDTHFGVANNTRHIARRNRLGDAAHTVLAQGPMFHALGSVITALSALTAGAALVLPAPSYSVRANLHALRAEKCTVVVGTPTMFVDLAGAVAASGAASGAGRVHVALTAGAPCSPQLFNTIRETLKADEVKSIYGMTELTASVFQSLPGDAGARVTDTVGALHDHLEVKVVDAAGRVTPLGSPGELLVRGYTVMKGYWADEAKTRETIDEDGWLHTGDLFTLDAEGYGRVAGRLKDVVVRGGENVAPKEVEDVLDDHPDVLESQVIGVADARLGEELAAVVRARAGAALTPAALSAHCAGRLARHKHPRLVRIVDAFPKTASGKIQKYRLREMFEKGEL